MILMLLIRENYSQYKLKSNGERLYVANGVLKKMSQELIVNRKNKNNKNNVLWKTRKVISN